MISDIESPNVNIPRGRLELSNKTYRVYDGLNTIGRNPGAVVNIKNLNISHQHAIITIIDRNTHFISDFKSSNGTTLNNKKLQPLKLYKLNHGASIKFADVHCTYKKVENNEDILDNWEATQDYNESFYSTNTQTVHLNNSNELNINEMPTQAFMPPPPPSFNDLAPRTLSINELPTQAFNLDDSDLNDHDNVLGETKKCSKTSASNKSPASVFNNDEPASDVPPPLSSTALSINELPTQAFNYDDFGLSDCQDLNATSGGSKTASKSPSRAVNTDEPVQGNTSKVLDETTNDSSNDSIDFMTMQKISESQAVGLGSEDKAEVFSNVVTPNQFDSESGAVSLQSVIKPVKLNSSKNILSTDSEGGQSTPEVMQPSEQGDTNEESALSQICPVKIGSKQVIGSDSEDSDTEEYNIPPKERRRSKYVISDDSETDIEDTGDNKCNNTTLNDTDVIASTQEVVNSKSETLNTSQPLEHSSLNSFRLEISELVDDNVEEPKVEEEAVAGTSLKDAIAEDHIYCSKPNSQESEDPVKSNSMEDHIYCKSPDDETQKSVEQNEEKVDNNVPDQVVEAQIKEVNDTEVSAIKIVEKSHTAQSQEPGTSAQKENGSGDKVEKKITEGDSQHKDEDETLSIIGDGDSNPLTEDFISNNIQKEEEKNLDENKLSSLQSPNGVEKNDKEENKQDDEDIFEQPTQQCAMDFVSDKKKNNYKPDDDVFLQPTQKMIGGSEKDEIDDDIYIQPTQRINDVHKKPKASETSDEDMYFQPTQQLVAPVETNREKSSAKDHEFARPFQSFGAEKASTSKKVEDDDDFLPPTQALEILHKEDKPDQPESLSNQSSNSSEVEDQMEMMFYSQSDERFNATQQLVDVLEDDDIVEDSMLEENRGTLKTAEFSTNDSIRMILDDFGDDSDVELNKTERAVARNDKTDCKRIVNKKGNDVSVLNIIESKDPSNKIKDTEKCPVKDNKLKNNKARSKKLDENQLKELKDKNNAARKSSGEKNSNDQKTEEVAEKSQEHKDEVFHANTSKKLSEDTNERKMEKKESQGSTDELKACRTKTRRKVRDDKANEEAGSSASNEGELVVTNASTNVSKGKAGRKTERKKSQDSTDKTEDNGTRTRRKLRNVVLENLDELNEEASSSTRDSKRKKTLKRSNTEDENQNMTGLETKEQELISRTRTKKEKTPDNTEGGVNVSGTISASNLSTRKQTKESDNEEDIRKMQDSKVSKEENTRTARKKEGSVASNSSDNSEKMEENDNIRTRRKRGAKKEDETISISKLSTRKQTKESDNDVEEDIREKQDSKVRKEENTRTARKKEGSVISNSSDNSEKMEENDNIRTRRKRGAKKEDSEVSNSSGKTEDNDEQLVSTSKKRTLKSSTVTITDFKDKARSKDVKTISEIENTPKAVRTRQKREGSVASDVSNRINQPSTSTASTRKRNLIKTTEPDSEDEFEPVISISSPKKKKLTTPQVVETPSIRKSVRTRKPKLFNDEVVSASSVSSQDGAISCSSTSTVNEQPPKKTRRLSANSRALKNEQVCNVKGKQISNQNASVLATPERSKRQLKPKVVFTMMDSPELESLIRQLGGSVVDTVDACTVLVTETVKRSQKLLCAVGQSKPICSPHWLQACKKAHTFLDPWDYILVDREAEEKWNFSLQESLRRSSTDKKLENHTFHIVVNTAADVLKGAIEACGGKCVTRNLAKADTDYKYIVSDKDCKAKYSKIVKANPGIEVVEKEAIFDGTLRQEFRFNDYLIT